MHYKSKQFKKVNKYTFHNWLSYILINFNMKENKILSLKTDFLTVCWIKLTLEVWNLSVKILYCQNFVKSSSSLEHSRFWILITFSQFKLQSQFSRFRSQTDRLYFFNPKYYKYGNLLKHFINVKPKLSDLSYLIRFFETIKYVHNSSLKNDEDFYPLNT